MKTLLSTASALLLVCSGLALAQSPAATASGSIGGKNVAIKYSAPSVRGRDVFSNKGVISHDPTYPVWRAGANNATALHTDADLDLGGLSVPKGDYTIYVNIKDPNAWELIVSKQTGQWGLTYEPKNDLGHVKMTMSKPASPVETLKYNISSQGGNKGTLELSWENHTATVPVTVK
jgi:hypothetical protein